MYACPRCKKSIADLTCGDCGVTYPILHGIPCFLSARPGDSGEELRSIYDDIYLHHEDVWIDQGRSGPFQRFFSELARSLSAGRVLELGCGEGTLLATLSATRKAGIDPSVHALIRARKRSDAECAVARAEELPFPSGAFDLVVAVGVMEHFEKPAAATAEVCRVLAPNGHYLVLIHIDSTLRDRLALKAREFLWPRPHPMNFAKWLRKKIWHPIVQPLRRSYTIDAARRCIEDNGFTVSQVITVDSHPDAPLAGRHVVILVAQRGAVVGAEACLAVI